MLTSEKELKSVAEKLGVRYCGPFIGPKTTIHIFNDDNGCNGSFAVKSPTVEAEIKFEILMLRKSFKAG